MNNFNLENYDLVVDRISEFYKRYPNGVIIAEILSDMGKICEYVVMRAKIWLSKEDYEDGKPPVGIGHAMEIAGSHGASKFSWLENAEQSSVGRALAVRDIWIKRKGASESEMKKVSESSDKASLGAPNGASDKPPMVLAGSKYGKPTVKQVVFVEKSLERIGMITPSQKKDYMFKVIGYDHLRDWKDVDMVLRAIRSGDMDIKAERSLLAQGVVSTHITRVGDLQDPMDDGAPFPDDNDLQI